MNAARAQDRLDAAGTAIVDGVERVLPVWVEARVAFVAEAWGRLDADARAVLTAAAREAADAATGRVVAALRDLFASDAATQRTTPLAIVRTAIREVTEVLDDAGIPPIQRDAFAERAFPDDVYGVTPGTLADLGDEGLGPLQLEWGLAKAAALRGPGGS